MIPRVPGSGRDLPAPHVVLAADDARLVETLDKALRGHHFRVTLALDGEDVLRRARSETPELVIAGLRLARKGGLELCDTLRREPDLSDVPILLLATADDPESRVEALAHGADDLIGKPFSAREIIARAQRLVSRARQSARHRQRSHELERELERTAADLRGARDEVARERSLRSLAGGISSELLHTLDLYQLDARLLREVCRQTGARSASLLARDESGAWASVAVRGDLPERWSELALPHDAMVAEWLRTSGHPLAREEMEKLPILESERARLTTHAVAVMALVPATEHAEAIVACEERLDGATFGAIERERLAVLCAAAAPARTAAHRFPHQQDRALELLSAWHGADSRRRDAQRESETRLAPLALSLGAMDRALLNLALRLGPWAWTAAGHLAVDGLAESDPTRRLVRLRDMLRDAEECASGDPPMTADLVAWLAATGLRYQSLRLSGRSTFESWSTAATWLGVQSRPELRDRFPEAFAN